MITNLAVTEGFLAWEALAACNGKDPEIFFPEAPRGRNALRQLNARIELAQVVCAQCPVRDRCRQKAHEVKATCGVWGGEFLGITRARRSAAE
jgi:hypothetical protein